MLVIINADDLGINHKVNKAIFKLMSTKLITSSTLIANAPYLKEAIKKIIYFPECSFGIHLNITEFQPLSSSNKLNTILDKNGRFSNNIGEIKITSSLSNAIYKEFCAQIEILFSHKIGISHIDTHQHIHTIPKIFPILKRIQKKYNIKKVRITKNIYSINDKVSRALLFKKKIYNFALRHYYPTRTTSGFTDFLTFYKKSKLNKVQHKSVEIMVHPGANSHKSKVETALLETSWKKNLIFNIKLINYNQL